MPITGPRARFVVFLMVLCLVQVGFLGLPATASAQQANPFWFLAEGSTAWGFHTWINLANPYSSAVVASVTYMTTAGTNVTRQVNLPPASQTQLEPYQDLGEADFSTQVECLDHTKSISVDRTMIWFQTGKGATPPPADATSSVGANSPSSTWYLPEGSAAWGFETWILVQNPNAEPTNVTLTFMIEGEASQSYTRTVPAMSRQNFDMKDFVGARDASIKVQSVAPVVAERSMFRHNKQMGHESIGATEMSKGYYLAEGSTAWGFTTFVLVQNPNLEAANVHLTFQTPAGVVNGPSELMPGSSRKTFNLNTILNKAPNVNGTDVSTYVSADREIVAERAVYWLDRDGKEAGHDSIGVAAPHSAFYFAGGMGASSVVWETYTMVQNPNSTEVAVRITYFPQNAMSAPHALDVTLPGNSRRTYRLQDALGAYTSASTLVQCLTPTMKLVAETSQYAGFHTSAASGVLNRSAGADTIGASADY